MSKIFLLLVALAGMTKAGAATCDVAGAVRLQANLAQLASWKESKNTVEVTWTDFVVKQGQEQQRKLIEVFANTDACITGRARQINFFGGGRLLGVASASTGISVIPFSAHPNTTPAPVTQTALTVRGRAINIGMSADEAFSILKPSEMLDQEVKGDPKLPGSLRVTKRYKADGKAFTLVTARTSAVGPYLVSSISLVPPAISRVDTVEAASHSSKKVARNEAAKNVLEKAKTASDASVKRTAEPAVEADALETVPITQPFATEGGTVDMSNCKPQYPGSSRRNEETGRVTLRFTVSPTGRVVSAYVHRSSGFRDLDQAAREALSKCTFHAAIIDGKAVATRIEVPYVFDLDK